MPDNQTIDITALLNYFRTEAQHKSPSATPYYRKAVSSLASYLATYPHRTDFPSQTTLADWYTHICLTEHTPKTSLLLLNSISGLYKKAAQNGLVPATTTFKTLKAKIQTLGDTPPDTIGKTTFDRILHHTRHTSHTQQPDIPADIILLSLLTGCTHPHHIATLKTTDIPHLDHEARHIAQRHTDPRRKYILDLRQSTLTTRQLSRHIDNLLTTHITHHRLPLTRDPYGTLQSYWAHAAIRHGIPGSHILGILGTPPPGIPVLTLCTPADPTPDTRRHIIRLVADTFTHDPIRWYAMRLRHNTSYSDIENRLTTLPGLPLPELFYPMREIAKKTGKKITIAHKPVLSKIILFRSRPSDLHHILRHIGDLAWCYRTSNTPGSPYAPIPNSQIANFQLCLGHLTKDIRLDLLPPAATFRKGRKVRVTGGIMAGYEGEIIDIDTTTGDKTFYLSIANDHIATWTLQIADHLIQPLD